MAHASTTTPDLIKNSLPIEEPRFIIYHFDHTWENESGKSICKYWFENLLLLLSIIPTLLFFLSVFFFFFLNYYSIIISVLYLLVFIYYCPAKAAVRDRMLYSSARASLLKLLESHLKIVISKRVSFIISFPFYPICNCVFYLYIFLVICKK